MKDEAFESVERLWVYLTAPQWRDTLRDNGALSSMQARNLVERFECEHSVFQSAQRRSLLRRIIPNLKDVGAKEKSCWWEAVGRQPSAVHVALSRQLDMVGVPLSCVRDVMSFNIFHHPALAAKLWSEVLDNAQRSSVVGLVADAWLDADATQMHRHWKVLLGEHAPKMKEKEKLGAISRLVNYIDDMVDLGEDPSAASVEGLHTFARLLAPADLGLLVNQPWRDRLNLMGPLVSEDEAAILGHAAQPATVYRARVRL